MMQIVKRSGIVAVSTGHRHVTVARVEGSQISYHRSVFRTKSPMRHQARFRELVERSLRRPAEGVAIVVDPRVAERELIRAQKAIVESEATRRGVPTKVLTPDEVRRGFVDRERPTNRQLALVLNARYTLVPSHVLERGASKYPSAAERRVYAAVLAIGAAILFANQLHP